MNAKIASLFFVLLCTMAANAVGVRFLAWDTDVATLKISVMTGGAATPITDLHPLKRSKVYKSTDNQPLKLRPNGKTNPDGSPADLDVKLEGFVKPLVIIMPNDKAPSGIAAIAIEDNTENFKWGSYLIFNATKDDMVISMNKEITKIPSGWKPVIVNPKVVDGASGVELRKIKEPQKVLYSMVWQGKSDLRRIVILLPATDARLGFVPKIIPEEKSAVAAEDAADAERAKNNP